MNIVSKILAGVYFHHFSGREEKEISGIGLFLAKLMLTLPMALFGILIIGRILETMSSTGTQMLPSSKIISFLFLLLFYPLIHYLSPGKEDLSAFIKQTDQVDLKKYNRYYTYSLITAAILFMILVLILKGPGVD